MEKLRPVRHRIAMEPLRGDWAREAKAWQTIDMGKPMSWQDFLKMPEDLQRLYLQGVMDKFHPSQRALAELFGTSKNTIAYRLKVFNIPPSGESRGGKNNRFDQKAWDAWIADGTIPEDNIDKYDDELDYIPDEVRAVHRVRKEMQEDREIEVVDAYLNKLSSIEWPEKQEKVLIPTSVSRERVSYDTKKSEKSVQNDIPKETREMYSKVLDGALKNEYRGQETDFSVLMDLWNSYLINSGDWLLNHRLTLGDIKVLLLLQNIERVMAEPYNDMYWDSVLEFVSFVKNNPEAF